MRRLSLVLLSVLCVLYVCPSCAFSAATPEPSYKTIKKEIRMGRKGAEAIEKECPRVIDPAEEAKLAMIAEKLTPHLKRPLEYIVRIIEMKEPNAFSLPGGRTYFTTGMMKFLKSEDEIAAVMCHEFVHADRAHAVIQARRNSALNLLSIAGLIAATQVGGSGAAGVAVMASGIQTAIANSYTIELEKEADAVGIDVLAKAGYNPSAMLTMMERLRLEKMKHAQVNLGIYQTHPEDEERVEAALKYLRDHGIKVDRKNVVDLLKVSTNEVSGDVVLVIDDAKIFSSPVNKGTRKLFSGLAEKLNNSLALELMPYDIKVIDIKGEKTLVIKRDIIITEHERVAGIPELTEVRNMLNNAIVRARGGNPVADYFR
ncbi:MAG: M48 family metallopeptidase [Synergistes sp.]|nr:M48 family metallopeptidase [Synergistes sp.]